MGYKVISFSVFFSLCSCIIVSFGLVFYGCPIYSMGVLLCIRIRLFRFAMRQTLFKQQNERKMLVRISTPKNTRTKDTIMREQRENNAQNKLLCSPQINQHIHLQHEILYDCSWKFEIPFKHVQEFVKFC